MKKCRQWVKARGTISPAGGHEAHLSAIAYMSDSYFIGTIARAHKLWRYSTQRKTKSKSSVDEDALKRLLEMDDAELRRMKFVDEADIERIRRMRNGEDTSKDAMPEIGMMVSLDHTIYFHNPRNFRADEWIFTEMETPWSGDGRGLVHQRMYTRDGTLIASCVQEASDFLYAQRTLLTRYRVLYACARMSLMRASCRCLISTESVMF
jgi:acyl-CoA thioesterase 8